MKRLLVVLLCVLAAAATLTACSSGNSPKELRIVTTPKTDYILGDEDELFNDSLKKGFVAFRNKNNTDSESIAMSDAKISVSGFSSLVAGDRTITVKHVDYPELIVTYDIHISPIVPISFKISDLPTMLNYSADVEKEDIVLTGGKIIETNNNASTNAKKDMTDAVEVVSITGKTATSAFVVVRLKSNVSLQEKFQINLVPVPVSVSIDAMPKYCFIDADSTLADISLEGLVLTVTKDNGETFTASGTDSDVVVKKSLSVETGKLTCTLIASSEEYPLSEEYNLSVEIDMLVLDEGALTATYFDDNYLTEFQNATEEEVMALFLAFESIRALTSVELAAYDILDDYLDSIVLSSFNLKLLTLAQLMGFVDGFGAIAGKEAAYTELCESYISVYDLFCDCYDAFFATSYSNGMQNTTIGQMYALFIADFTTTYNTCIGYIEGPAAE